MPATVKLTSPLLAAAALLVAAPVASAQSSYVTPKNGAWKVQDIFENTAGGKATVAKNGTQLKGLELTIGADRVEACGAGKVKVTKTLSIKRVGSYKRPAVGRLSSKTKLIESTSTKVSVEGGAAQDAKVKVLFDKNGKTAFTAELTYGERCRLSFALRK